MSRQKETKLWVDPFTACNLKRWLRRLAWEMQNGLGAFGVCAAMAR